RHRLRLPNRDATPILAPAAATVLDVTAAASKARELLATSQLADNLVHASFDADGEVKGLLVGTLGSGVLKDSDVLSVIADESSARSSDHDWVWRCWKWLAEWGEKHGDVVAGQLAACPVLPLGQKLVSVESLGAALVTWREGSTDEVPHWLPLRYVNNW